MSVTCPFCGSNHTIMTNQVTGIKPHRIIPFQIPSQNVKDAYRKWLRKKIFVPRKVKNKFLILNLMAFIYQYGHLIVMLVVLMTENLVNIIQEPLVAVKIDVLLQKLDTFVFQVIKVYSSMTLL